MARQDFIQDPQSSTDEPQDTEGWHPDGGFYRPEGSTHDTSSSDSEHDSATGHDGGAVSPSKLSDQEKTPAAASSQTSSKPSTGIADQERAGAGGSMNFRQESGSNQGGSKIGNFFKRMFSSTRAKSTSLIAAAVITLGAGTGGVQVATYLTGPGEAIAIGHALELPFAHGEEQEESESGTMLRWYRFARTGDIAQTRLGALSSKVYGSALKQMDAAGITIEKDPITARPTRTVIDPEKLATQNSNLKGVDPNSEQARKIIGNALEVDPANLKPGAGGKITIELKGSGTGSLRLLTSNITKVIGDGAALRTANAFVLKKAFGLYSILHPFSRAGAAAQQKFFDTIRASEKQKGKSDAEADKTARTQAPIEAEKAAYAESIKPVQAGAVEATENIKNAKSSFVSGVVRGLTFTGAACIVRDVAGSIAKANQDIVVLPAAIQATRVIAAGEQTKSGQGGIDGNQVGAMVQTFRDKQGTSVTDGRAMQVLMNPTGTPAGPDLPGEYQQAFNGESKAATIKSLANKSLGGEDIAKGTCSTPSLILQGALAVTVTIGSEVLTGGAATPAVTGGWAAQFARSTVWQFVVVGAVVGLIEHVAIDSQLPQEIFQGALGGNLLAYGARASSNLLGAGAGGFDLGNTSTTIARQTDSSSGGQALKTRLFSTDDSNSLLSRATTAYYTSGFHNGGLRGGLAEMASSLTNISSLFSRTFGSLVPHASAASTYDWGFGQIALPDKIANNPDFDNATESGAKVAQILQGPKGQLYIDKANACFGRKIIQTNEGWDVIYDHKVDPSSEDYTNADCTADSIAGGISAYDWQRVTRFVFQTNVVKHAACASGADTTVCDDAGATTATATGVNPDTTGAQQNGQGVQLDGIDDLIVSNQFPSNTQIIPKVTNVVIHWLDSNPESPEEAQAALAGNGGTSVQFYVSQSGKIMQLTPYANSEAGHAKNANAFAVGIEIGSPNDQQIGDSPPYPKLQAALMNNATQKAQVIKLATALAKKFGITTVTVGNQVLYTASDTCAALGLSFPGTCASQAEAAPFGIVGHYQLQNTKSDPGPDYIQEIQKGVKANLGI